MQKMEHDSMKLNLG